MRPGVLRKTWPGGESREASCGPEGWTADDATFAVLLSRNFPSLSTTAGVPWVISFNAAVDALGAEAVQTPEADTEIKVRRDQDPGAPPAVLNEEAMVTDWDGIVERLLARASERVSAGILDPTGLTQDLTSLAEEIWEDLGTDWSRFLEDEYLSGLHNAFETAGPVEGEGKDGWAPFLRDILINAKMPPRDSWGQFMTAKAKELSDRLAQGWKQAAGVVSEEVAKIVTRGISEGRSPVQIADDLTQLDGGAIPSHRALAIATTESTRAYAEGQLEGFKRLGVQEVSSDRTVELQVQGKNVCPECSALAKRGPVPLQEAVGKIPVHVNCKCRWKLSKRLVSANEDAEAEAEEPTDNIFCKTGPGGGVNPTCSPKKGGAASPTSPHEEVRQRIEKLGERRASLQRDHDELGGRLEHVRLRQTQTTDPTERKALRGEQDRLEGQRHQLRKQMTEIDQEAHKEIKEHLGKLQTERGQQGSPVNKDTYPDPTGVNPGHALIGEVAKARAFLDGMVSPGPDGKATTPVTAVNGSTGRSGYYSESRNMDLGRNSEARSAVHEYGHHLEATVPGVKAAAQEFLAKRTAGEDPVSLRDKFPERGYGASETGRKDKFDTVYDGPEAYYVGKQYAHGATEVVSMGIEKLYTDPTRMAKNDPEYFHFVMGVLSGDARKP